MAEHRFHNQRAHEIAEQLFPHGPGRLAQLERLDPAFSRMVEDFLYGGLYARDILDQKTRELCAVAALTVLNYQGQLARHLLSALDRGASRQELVEVILQMSVYGGFPATSTALSTLKGVLDQVDQATAAEREA